MLSPQYLFYHIGDIFCSFLFY